MENSRAATHPASAHGVVEAVVLELPEAEAMVVGHRLDNTRQRSALEEGWLLQELREHHDLQLQDLACKLDRSKSWVSRRLALVRVLPVSVQLAGPLRPPSVGNRPIQRRCCRRHGSASWRSTMMVEYTLGGDTVRYVADAMPQVEGFFSTATTTPVRNGLYVPLAASVRTQNLDPRSLAAQVTCPPCSSATSRSGSVLRSCERSAEDDRRASSCLGLHATTARVRSSGCATSRTRVGGRIAS